MTRTITLTKSAEYIPNLIINLNEILGCEKLSFTQVVPVVFRYLEYTDSRWRLIFWPALRID